MELAWSLVAVAFLAIHGLMFLIAVFGATEPAKAMRRRLLPRRRGGPTKAG